MQAMIKIDPGERLTSCQWCHATLSRECAHACSRAAMPGMLTVKGIVTEVRSRRQSAVEICRQVVERIHGRDAILQSFESLDSASTIEATHIGVLASRNWTRVVLTCCSVQRILKHAANNAVDVFAQIARINLM